MAYLVKLRMTLNTVQSHPTSVIIECTIVITIYHSLQGILFYIDNFLGVYGFVLVCLNNATSPTVLFLHAHYYGLNRDMVINYMRRLGAYANQNSVRR